jgi:PKD repeat protein
MTEITERYIKSAIIILVLVFVLPFHICAQFEIKTITPLLTKTSDSGVNWVDIDGDGDLDLAMSGFTPFIWEGQGKLYLNSSGVITYNKDIRALETGDQKWCDINHDGRPELIYAGEATGPTAGIDVFDAALNYTSFPSGFTPVSNASIDWGDYDNDGDYDVLISGLDAAGYLVTKLYSNNKGSFSEISTNLPGIMYGKVGFIDYDLDQDLDIFITGRDINENKYTRLWRNTNGTYTITNDLFVNLEYSHFDWGDINGDGYPDLLLGGYNSVARRGYLFINNSGNGFTLSPVTVPQIQQGSCGFGDVDNDGDLDIFASGYKSPYSITNKFIFLNNSGSFVPTAFTSDSVSKSFLNFGDYDGDDDLDFVMNGKKSNGSGLTIVGNNLCPSPNLKPSAPQNLSAVVEGKSVRLNWDRSTDNNTPANSLTYNIYIGTTPGGIDIVAPNALVSTGFRKISRQGYIRDNGWTIKNLPVGTYHWGVQSIDNSLGSSPFSAGGTFEIKERFTLVQSTETPINTSPASYFDCDHDGDIDLFLNTSSVFYAIENKLTPFTQADYKTILASGLNPIKTLTPNDYNNNNLIDFTMSGIYFDGGFFNSPVRLYGYNTPFNYNVVNSELIKDVDFEYVLWADFNNDGKQDIITSGKTTNLTTNIPVTYMYQNMGGGAFQVITHSIRGFEKVGAVTGDFDNDMDIDILIYGKDASGMPNTYLYINEGNFNFTEKLVPNNELYKQSLISGIVTGDYDQDGQLDIYMGGANTLNDNYARVLLNKNTDFTDANLQLRSSPNMSNFWADYDYDGDLDIYSVTSYASPDKTRLYLNNNGTLQETIIDLGAQHKMDLPFVAANLDNMNGLDFLMKINGGNYFQYYDNWGSNTRLNSAPGNTGYEQDQLDIVLHWDKLTECPGCTYNIRIGTQPDNVNIMSPMSDLTTGYRYVIQPGNAYLNNGWRIKGLPVGTYHWSVQAIDQANTGGPWAPLSTFTLTQINAEFSFTTVCNKEATQFNDLSVATNSVVSWTWDFGDGTSSTLQNPEHIYADAGTYTVGLTAWSQTGESAFKSHPVDVKAIPVTNFAADIACQGTSTTFTNTTEINGLTISNWLWNFGDGQSSTTQNPAPHGYLNAGDYTTELWAFATNGCNSSVQKTVRVGSNPSVEVTADAPLTFCEGGSVTLSVANNPSYTYQWKLDGNSLTGANSGSLSATQSGIYTVVVINPVGNCTKTSDPKTITVNPAPASPLINASGSSTFCQGDSILLNVQGNPAYNYQWKLNGGAVGTNSNQLYAKNSGRYILSLTNASGCSVYSVNYIDVNVSSNPTLPSVNISGPTTFCQGSSVELSVSNTAGYSYQWENNGAGIPDATSVAYLAQNSGVYSLRITNSSNCSIKTEAVTVSSVTAPAAPIISAGRETTFCQGESVDLSVTNNSDYKYEWKLNGGAVGTNSNQYSARNSGRYTVIVSNSTGCSVSSVNYVDVTLLPLPEGSTVNLNGPASFCEGGNVTLSVTPNSNYTYTWRNGATTVSLSPVYTANTTGVYQLEIKNSSGCLTKTTNVDVTVKPMPAKPVISALNYSDNQCPPIDTKVKLYMAPEIAGYKYQWFKNGIQYSNGTLSYLEDYLGQGDYTVETDLNGCKILSDNKNLTYAIAPEKPTILVRGPVVWYMATSKNSYKQYKWYFNDELIQGATKYIYVANKKLGTYRVEVADDKCFTSSDKITIPVTKSEMADFNIPAEYMIKESTDVFENIKIYPNPTPGLFTIEMDNDVMGELNISIITHAGKEILKIRFEKTTRHFSSQIDLSGQPKGLYIINLMIDKYFATRKLVVE